MTIPDLFGRGRPVFSFEFFPPKSDEAARGLMKTIADLKAMHQPDFVSVTYGAGGSTRDRTLELVSRVQGDLGLTAMAHLTCVGHDRAELASVVDRLRSRGVRNVLALRGDPPKGETEFRAVDGGFQHANELIEFLRGGYDDLGVGAACYPEKHPESPDGDDDLRWTVNKVESGADFLITQLFFDNQDYFRFVEQAREAGIGVPIVPGIMPITNVSQIQRFTKMCGACLPEDLLERLVAYQEQPDVVMAIGIEHAIRQCRRLLDAGAPGVHFYTLNKSHATRPIIAAIRDF
ncbi:MAG: methylenetetrahydrofolate reductase [NAD(P)H] [Planctomycetota bacterium]